MTEHYAFAETDTKLNAATRILAASLVSMTLLGIVVFSCPIQFKMTPQEDQIQPTRLYQLLLSGK